MWWGDLAFRTDDWGLYKSNEKEYISHKRWTFEFRRSTEVDHVFVIFKRSKSWLGRVESDAEKAGVRWRRRVVVVLSGFQVGVKGGFGRSGGSSGWLDKVLRTTGGKVCRLKRGKKMKQLNGGWYEFKRKRFAEKGGTLRGQKEAERITWKYWETKQRANE